VCGDPKSCWALLVACVAAACAPGGIEYDGIPGRPTPARFVSWVPAVEVGVDGAPPGTFLVDTGAPLTMLDVAAHPQLAPGARTAALSAFELSFPAMTVAVFDVFPGSATAIDGILGGDLLRHFSLAVDYRGGRVWLDDGPGDGLPVGVDDAGLEPPLTLGARVRGGGTYRVPGDCPGGCGSVRVGATRLLVSARIEGGDPVWLLVDTGASAVVLEAGLVPDAPGRPRLSGVTVGTSLGPMTASFVRIASLALGDAPAGGSDAVEAGLPVLVLPDGGLLDGLTAEVGVEVRGLVGGTFLRNYLTAIDYPGAALTLRRYAERDHVDPDEFIRVGFTLRASGGTWRVADVYPGTAAAAQGLAPGEVVARLDGVELDGAGEATVAGLLAGFALGEEVPVAVARAAGIEVLHIAVEDLLPDYP
jgi:hypothetical protein